MVSNTAILSCLRLPVKGAILNSPPFFLCYPPSMFYPATVSVLTYRATECPLNEEALQQTAKEVKGDRRAAARDFAHRPRDARAAEIAKPSPARPPQFR